MTTLTKVSADDFITEDRPAAFTVRAQTAPALGGPYLVQYGRLGRVRWMNHARVIDPLCNFVARVTEELVLDDGAETTRAFVLEGQLDNGLRLPLIRVPASKFSGMTWVTEGWGHRAVIRAGMGTRDHLREAIQTLSPAAVCRHIATYNNNVLVRLKPAGEPEVDTADTTYSKDKTSGAAATVRRMTASIVAIDKGASSVTFEGPNGWKYSRRVVDPTVLDKVQCRS
jgi:hypothetical protein